MVDAADHEKLDASKNELHSLLDKPQLAGIPVRHSCIIIILTRALTLPHSAVIMLDVYHSIFGLVFSLY